MATRKSRKNRSVSQGALGKPRGVIQERVRKVGPEKFGIVAVDCAKARSKWMLCDFYGKVLIPPTEVEHQKAQLQLATTQLRDACVLDKLLTFHQSRKTPPHEILRDLQHAAEQIPKHEQTAEAQPLQARYERSCRSRRKGVQPISEILLAVLARYGITGIACEESRGSRANESDTST